MNNLVLITSVMNICDKPFSYIPIRSTFTYEERFEQTKSTIASIKDKIPNVKILFVECSDLTDEHTNYIIENVDYFINIYSSIELRNMVEGLSKSLGENILILTAIEYIKYKNINYDNFFKLSGRYWLGNNFNYDNYNNDKIVYAIDGNNPRDVFTSLYKINKKYIQEYEIFIKTYKDLLKQCCCAEIFFGLFLMTIPDEHKHIINKIGVNGYIAVCENLYIDN